MHCSMFGTVPKSYHLHELAPLVIMITEKCQLELQAT
jgi:hypothetical protein